MSSNNTPWTEDRVSKLKELWTDGWSASYIAIELGGVSRSAVLGKVDRLNLPLRATKHSKSGARAPRQAHHHRRRPDRFFIADNIDRPSSEIDDKKIPVEQRKCLMDLCNQHCRWPVGEPRGVAFFFCGSPTANLMEGRPYCEAHTWRSKDQTKRNSEHKPKRVAA